MRTVRVSEDSDNLRLFWDAYAQATPGIKSAYTIWALGDNPALGDELAAMVVDGSKRATVRLLRDFVAQHEPVPQPGDHVVVVDGHSTPRCVIRIVRTEIKEMRNVSERFVRQNGEGDGSVAWWVNANMRYFKRQGAREGFAVGDRTEVAFIDFVVVWPMQRADSFSDAERQDRSIFQTAKFATRSAPRYHGLLIASQPSVF